MKKAAFDKNEEARIALLKSKGLENPTSDAHFNEITQKAKKTLNVAICTVAILNEQEEIFLACAGTSDSRGPRDISFCGHALLQEDVLIIEDTLEDIRFKDNPYVTGVPFVRFYAGMRLLDKNTGLPLGVFCVKDSTPRKLTMEELGLFLEYAAESEALLQNLLK